ncbi:unknown [Euproctis pseudoconspersa nucleopolyhedrovirus]|uniref:RING-type domain-containing protein n=1 Tax=Euproctis pseudoconspersa nucleopolyhedrovirus TaxID=307467 RepID=C3TWY6_9ABAC|nr:hypothetical protein EupsNPV_gp078 [Euproctis pseudoconspersa nucleopolyhedrovirus]ACO53528.1 unknown [Euproctis pseudoconspersa nucleopolyhedrovirus]
MSQLYWTNSSDFIISEALNREIINFIAREFDDGSASFSSAIFIEITNVGDNIEYEPAEDDDDSEKNNQEAVVFSDKKYKKIIKIQSYNKSKSLNDCCCVCFENFTQKQRLATIKKCKHSFCVECLRTWMTLKKTKCCPMCRMPIK